MEDKGIENGYAFALNRWALDKDIKNEVGLLIIISSLCADKGYCWASNEYFGQLLHLPTKTISRKIKLLEDKNYISIEYKRVGTQITSRFIKIPNLGNTIPKNEDEPSPNLGIAIPKNVEEKNISIKNINIKNIVEEYENEIGLLTPYGYQRLESYFEDLPEEVIIEAIHIASANNKKTLSYIEAILKRWIKQGYKCIADIKNTKNKKSDETTEERVKRILGGK
jgi:DnaD/phage-associated family protein